MNRQFCLEPIVGPMVMHMKLMLLSMMSLWIGSNKVHDMLPNIFLKGLRVNAISYIKVGDQSLDWWGCHFSRRTLLFLHDLSDSKIDSQEFSWSSHHHHLYYVSGASSGGRPNTDLIIPRTCWRKHSHKHNGHHEWEPLDLIIAVVSRATLKLVSMLTGFLLNNLLLRS